MMIHKMKASKLSIFEKKEHNMMLWVSYWRMNPHRFASEYLGLNLYFFQKIIIFMMNRVPNTKYIASRSQGKSFITAVYIVIRAILYPGTRIVIASKTLDQARKIIADKIVELARDHPAINGEIKEIKTGINSARVVFMNGSIVELSTSSESARGARANVLVIDEYAQVDHEAVTSILRPMAGTPRTPTFKKNYPNKYRDYNEPNIEIMLSSAWYKSHWSYGEFINSAERMMDNAMSDSPYHFVCAIPYPASIFHGILLPDAINELMTDRTFDRLKFQMEYEGIFVGESKNSYYSLAPINSSRQLEKSFIPPSHLEYMENAKRSNPKSLGNMPKQPGEVRLVGLDVAIVGGKTNDTSVFTLMRMLPDKDGSYARHVVRVETDRLSRTDTKLAIRLKQLYYDFEADYVVLDTMGPGDSVYLRCAEILYDAERDVEYPAWESINDKNMRDRVRNINSERIVFTIKASADFNTKIITNLRSSFDNGILKLLVDDVTKREHFIEVDSKFLLRSVEEQQELLEPFQQTTALVNELISLEYSTIAGQNIKVVAGANGTKDRFSSIAYTNYKAYELELELKNSSKSNSYSDYMFNFNWKK